MVAAHLQKVTHSYVVAYPEHGPRWEDPHWLDFEHYRAEHIKTAKCDFGLRRGDFTECVGQLELHHSHIEFALLNSVDLGLLERDYPGVSNPYKLGAWLETAANLVFLCEYHHRGRGGVHVASVSAFEGEHYVRDLIR